MSEPIEKYQELCAYMYQLAGNHKGSLELMDVLHFAASGEELSLDTLPSRFEAGCSER